MDVVYEASSAVVAAIMLGCLVMLLRHASGWWRLIVVCVLVVNTAWLGLELLLLLTPGVHG